jgi:tetratricopeptide (TPR) repeat protein
MKKYLWIILLIVLNPVIQAQNPNPRPANPKTIDSLHFLLMRERVDTTRVKLFLLLFRTYKSAQQRDSALLYARQALLLAQKSNDIKGEMEALSQMSSMYWEIGNYPVALQLALQNLHLAEQTKDTMNIVQAISNVGRTYFEMNDFQMTLVHAQKVKQLIHSGFFKHEKDIRYNSMMGYLLLIAIAYLGLNQFDSALYYTHRTHEIAVPLKHTRLIAATTLTFGNIYSKTRDYDSAFHYYRMSLSYAQSVKSDDFIAETYLGMAKLFQQGGQIDSAIYYGKQSLAMNQRLEFPADELKATSLLYELYTLDNRADSAHKYLVLTNVLKDSLYSQEKGRQIQNIQFNEMQRLQQLEQARKEAKLRYETRVKIFSLVGGLVIFLLIALKGGNGDCN